MRERVRVRGKIVAVPEQFTVFRKLQEG